MNTICLTNILFDLEDWEYRKSILKIFPGFDPLPISRVLRLFLYPLSDIYLSEEFSDLNLIINLERKHDGLTDA
jgi:hypothetical protein